METWVAIIIGAVGTWFIAIFAIADRVKSWWIKPELRVDKGSFSSTVAIHGNGKRARYYLVRVRNHRMVPPAHEAQLVLTRLEKSGASEPVVSTRSCR